MTIPFSPETARAWVDIDLAALVANARTVATISGRRLMPMVKANGYGLGGVEVARALTTVDPWGFGVATVEEGTALRAGAIDRPILVVTPLLPGDVDRHLAQELRPSIGDPASLQAWIARSNRPFHIEVDTGMSRGGVRWNDGAALDAMRGVLAAAEGWEGIYTHFHSAETDVASAQVQWERLQGVVATMPGPPRLVHAANSAAALRGLASAADLIRPGIFLYGGRTVSIEPRPVAALRARVVAVRTVEPGGTVSYGATWAAASKAVVATLAIGYADGFPRAVRGAPGSGLPRLVELAGRTVPVVGRVTMDLTMVAVEGPVALGDVATIYGGSVSLDQQAEAAGTISYELLTYLGSRLPRRYTGA